MKPRGAVVSFSSPFGSGSTIFLSFPDLMYSSTLEINIDIPLGEKKHKETSQSEGPIDTLNM